MQVWVVVMVVVVAYGAVLSTGKVGRSLKVWVRQARAPPLLLLPGQGTRATATARAGKADLAGCMPQEQLIPWACRALEGDRGSTQLQ